MITWADAGNSLRVPTEHVTSTIRVGPTPTGGCWRENVCEASRICTRATRSVPAPPPPFRGIALAVELGAFLCGLLGVTISWVW